MSRNYNPREPQRPSSEPIESEAPSLAPESRSPGHNPASLSSGDSRVLSEGHRRASEPREVHELRGRTVRVRASEVAAMVELGKFRAIAERDLTEFFYGGELARFRPDMENLVRQGLVEGKAIPHEETGSRTLLTLTKRGYRFLTETAAVPQGQALYYGFTKPREAHHDADLYRLYQKAAGKIERAGGKNLRVVLDYEMKKRVYHDLAKLGKARSSSAEKGEVAERHGLTIVRGKIPVPDVRIEYETREGERARVDLELATGHYRGRSLAEKVRAGFAIYANAGETAKLRKILDQRELTAEILSL